MKFAESKLNSKFFCEELRVVRSKYFGLLQVMSWLNAWAPECWKPPASECGRGLRSVRYEL